MCCWGGSYILVGVTSWGSSTCKNYPSVYTDVSTISPWITSTVMALRNHHCTENTNSPVKLYWWTEECDTWYGWIYACTLTESMTWPRRHQLSSRQYSASSLRFYLKFMLFSLKIFSWGMRFVILKFRWRLNLVVFRSSYLPLRNRNGLGRNATCSSNHTSLIQSMGSCDLA